MRRLRTVTIDRSTVLHVARRGIGPDIVAARRGDIAQSRTTSDAESQAHRVFGHVSDLR